MPPIVETISSVKEAPSYIAMSTGAGMTQAPISIVQIAGFVIGAGGLIVAVLRWGEARRTNNLAAEKWEHEKCQKSERTESQTPKQ